MKAKHLRKELRRCTGQQPSSTPKSLKSHDSEVSVAIALAMTNPQDVLDKQRRKRF
jgi:hypothetical protein